MLELRGACAGYGNHVVLRDVDLTVPKNSVIALLGPNGAGKTTLLKAAAGLLRLQSGELLIEDQDARRWSPNRMAEAGVCYVPEGRGIFRDLTVKENLRLQAPRHIDLDAVPLAVEAFPVLGQRLNQRAGTMSGGEQQMLALAQAWVTSPKLVLLDEVSLGLAPKLVDEIFDYLRQIAERGAALLLVEQYVSRALALADHVYILKKGRAQFVADPAELNDETLLASYLGV